MSIQTLDSVTIQKDGCKVVKASDSHDIEFFHDEESNRDYYIDGDGETHWKE